MDVASKREPDSDGAAERRKQIIRAAVEVFAERGFHRTRVSDIAKRAGVAYGLICHYFESKNAVLDAVFDKSWSNFLKMLRAIRDEAEPAGALDKLELVIDRLIDALEIARGMMQVVIHEVSRSSRFAEADKQAAFREAFEIVREIIEEGQRRGEVREDIDPMVSAHAFFGALEIVCSGVILERVDTDAGITERAKRTVRAMLLDGLEPAGGERRALHAAREKSA